MSYGENVRLFSSAYPIDNYLTIRDGIRISEFTQIFQIPQ